jgi:hypothetical protein
MVETKNGLKQEAEDKEKIQHIATQILEPALRGALAEARKQGSAQEVVSAMANCYGGLLVDTLGRKAAATFLQGHAVHLTSLEE